MKAEHANIFIRSAVEVFQKESGIRLSRRSLSTKTAPIPSLPVSVIIGITGFVRGQVVYSMDTNFAYNAAKGMLPNRLPEEARRLINSAVSEIASMITGKGIQVDFLTLPTVYIGLISEIGLLEVNIAFARAAEG